MSQETDVLRRFEHLPPKERAAALAHWIYVQTTHRGGWTLRVSEDLGGSG